VASASQRAQPTAYEQQEQYPSKAKESVDEPPVDGYPANGAQDDGVGKDKEACGNTEWDDPSTGKWVANRHEKGDSYDEVSETKPVITIHKKGIAGGHVLESYADKGEPCRHLRPDAVEDRSLSIDWGQEPKALEREDGGRAAEDQCGGERYQEQADKGELLLGGHTRIVEVAERQSLSSLHQRLAGSATQRHRDELPGRRGESSLDRACQRGAD